ncbi:hypothetical protein WICPIJ_002401 [Wickerhamomyces pijperi]|uniref:GPI-anchored wall transfer protein n=1 Tax=Wickerhamomyces pijperi TaxID=599730 RepID=A0A9P8Q9R7_WICPI|nr:hypothetical protein WICPIJ_002401 [Wickerhamomyces pijperi]
MSESLKIRKESFVSNHSGSNIPLINLITSLALVSYFNFSYLNHQTSLFQGDNKWSWGSLTIDWFLQWGVLLLGVTVYSGSTWVLIIGSTMPVLLLSFMYREQRPINKSQDKSKTQNKTQTKTQPNTIQTYLPQKPSLTAYRSSMLILTSISILAVDFPIFPRAFAKVETWGTSLMDLGVGSFVFSMGIITMRPLLAEKLQNKQHIMSYLDRVMGSIKGTSTCLILGLIRLIAVKGLEYQEHVSEYGVHWNFFITLVLVGPITIIISPVFQYIPRLFIALIIGVVYEMCLNYKEGLLSFLLLGQRTDLFSANKEGIFSLIGYVAIFIAGQGVGCFVLPSVPTSGNLFSIGEPQTQTQSRDGKTKYMNKWLKYTTVGSSTSGLLITFIIYLTLAFITMETPLITSLPVSRRLANLSYILWVCAYNTGFLYCFFAFDSIFGSTDSQSDSQSQSVSLQAVNKNGMFVFLIANLSTGLVNMSLNTLDCGNAVAMLVLTLYCVSIWGVCVWMLYKGWGVKI